jgi:hypothetical protein
MRRSSRRGPSSPCLAQYRHGVTFVAAFFQPSGRPDQPTVALQLMGWLLELARQWWAAHLSSSREPSGPCGEGSEGGEGGDGCGQMEEALCVGVLVDGGSLRSDDVSLAQPDSAENLDICP